MSSVNKVIIVGNLGRDPEMRYLPSGDAVCNVSVATTARYKDKATGDMKEATEWHRISFFSKLAEIAGQYLEKGSSVYVEGSLRTRKYTDKDGAEKVATEIRGEVMKMLGGYPEQSNTPQQKAATAKQASKPAPSSGFDDMEDDIPFN